MFLKSWVLSGAVAYPLSWGVQAGAVGARE
ncbi:hypothetical protein E2C01_065883 [Portunus trituberculatus]|uniref:Uncharacterized protein n=1 Tax=Portunus trituberculatus TaxID=210409 RepID=A0A5B7HGR6_PORTR|nr:hypothetical protein [Portunus trituberculatus]